MYEVPKRSHADHTKSCFRVVWPNDAESERGERERINDAIRIC